jgi:endonuclease YncB( thermonuclease family)
VYEYQAILVEVHDGDTVRLVVDLGFSMWRTRDPNTGDRYRLARINAPELRDIPAGPAAANYLKSLLPDIGLTVRVKTYKDPDNYGRYLVELFTPEGESVNDLMVSSGHAEVYGAKK